MKTIHLIFLLALIGLLTATPRSLLVEPQSLPDCFYRQLGDVPSGNFRFRILKNWNSTQETQLKSGALNTSSFIRVSGWRSYDPAKPYEFFTRIGKWGLADIQKLTPIKNVLRGSDAPEYGLNDPSLFLAFGYPSTAKVYQVPENTNFVLLRFQTKVQGAPYIGSWSVLLDIVDADQIYEYLDLYTTIYKLLSAATRLKTLDVTKALNIITPFTENSIFWSLLSLTTPLPAVGSYEPVIDTAFIERLQPGQQVLAGFIANGQQDIIQIKDRLPGSRKTPCPP